MKTLSAAEANRQFSYILREVQKGETFTVTSRGRPVAEVSAPKAAAKEEERRRKAREALRRHLDTTPTLDMPITWTRDDVYDDGF